MTHGYFEIGEQIEQSLREAVGDDIKLFCNAFTVNDPNETVKAGVSLHISPLPAELINSVGNGKAQSERQRWQITIAYASPRNDDEIRKMREKISALILKSRRAVQGLKVFFDNGQSFVKMESGLNFDMTRDCRLRLFSFVVGAVITV